MGKWGVAAYICSPMAEERKMGGSLVLMGDELQVQRDPVSKSQGGEIKTSDVEHTHKP